MSPIYILLCAVLLVAQLTLPRRYAFAPLLIAVCHFQNVTVVQIGLGFTITKLVILVGLLRALRERTLVWTPAQRLDFWIAVWAGWLILSGFAHNPKDHNPITLRLNQAYNVFGAYLYARSFIRSHSDIIAFCKCLVVVMLPLAFETIVEKTLVQNYYVMLAGAGEGLGIRGGKVRAAGPFGHPILLGCVAATSVPLCAMLWLKNRKWAIFGGVVCVVVVFCSASSGPILTLISGLMALGLWRWRTSVKWVRRGVLLTFITLHLVMQAPIWFLMARVDLAGGSTGWHRAELIQQAINYFGDWWLVGTDYTRHWFPYGVGWSEYHTDITNHYLQMGVTGGLPLMIFFIIVLRKAFQLLSRRIGILRSAGDPEEFTPWCAGSALFAHCVTFFSISYFDQSVVAFAMLLGALPGLCFSSPTRVIAESPNSTEPTNPELIGANA